MFLMVLLALALAISTGSTLFDVFCVVAIVVGAIFILEFVLGRVPRSPRP